MPGGTLLTAIAGWDNMLLELWKTGFAMLGQPVPYYTAEDVEAATDHGLQPGPEGDVILRVERIGVVREVDDPSQRLGNRTLSFHRVVEIDVGRFGNPAARNRVGAAVVMLPLPSEDDVLFETAANARGRFGKIRHRPPEMLELQILAVEVARRLDDEEFSQEVVVVHRPVGEGIAKSPGIVELPRVDHLQVVIVDFSEVERRPVVSVARHIGEDALGQRRAEIGVEQRDAGVPQRVQGRHVAGVANVRACVHDDTHRHTGAPPLDERQDALLRQGGALDVAGLLGEAEALQQCQDLRVVTTELDDGGGVAG